MNTQNVFNLITDDPVVSGILLAKSRLAMTLVDIIRKEGWSQVMAAEKLSISQPRMSNLFTGKLCRFSVDTLLEMLLRLGYCLEVDFNPDSNKEPLLLRIKSNNT